MSGPDFDSLTDLRVACPETADRVAAQLKQLNKPIDSEVLPWLVSDVIWGLSQEQSLGEALASGYVTLMGRIPLDRMARYHRQVRKGGRSGPTLARLMAESLVPVLLHGDDGFLRRFLKTVDTMLTKGIYTLPASLALISHCLETGDAAGAGAYLSLLTSVFRQEMNYNRSRHLAQLLPKAAGRFTPPKRAWRLRAVERVARAGLELVDPVLEGLADGTASLNEDALNRFITRGLEGLAVDRSATGRFLSLSSEAARQTCAALQVAAGLSQMASRLNRYLTARIGRAFSVKPISSLAGDWQRVTDGSPMVLSDGRHVYLPEEIERYSSWSANQELYRVLVRLEAGYYDCNTFGFDLDKALQREAVGRLARHAGFGAADTIPVDDPRSELTVFFELFPDPDLSRDLFAIFEHGRIYRWMARHFPGVMRQARPALQEEIERLAAGVAGADPLFTLYCRVALGETPPTASRLDANRAEIDAVSAATDTLLAAADAAEASAELVARFYPTAASWERPSRSPEDRAGRALSVPFGRHPRPDLVFRAHRERERTARRLQQVLRSNDIAVYRSDIKQKLQCRNDVLSIDDIRSLCLSRRVDAGQTEPSVAIQLSDHELAAILGVDTPQDSTVTGSAETIFRYREWDCYLQDYLNDHVRVRKIRVAPVPNDFFRRTLDRHGGLVRRIRRSFECLKPEGLKLLRKWQEGDGFDYRALLDFAVDRKVGVTPSDKIYLKRLKQDRDVAVLVLVDLSRSTANRVAGTEITVLDLEKESIVLLCEALGVVEDRFSIAGFSGTGRLGVDYYVFKAFDDPFDDTVRQRIGAMTPQRSTRMGAAVRHAAHELGRLSAGVKLLLLMGDGFPNDAGYKREYAVADTRRAIAEARSRDIFTHSITVNVASDGRLDALYGRTHHNIISDVRDLPDKLFRIYSLLTRQPN